MEGDLSCLNFPVLLVHLVADQHDWDVIADSSQIFIPLGHVLVGDSGGDIEHEYGGLGSNVVPFSEPAQLFLAGGVPETELDGPVVGIEDNGADFDSLSGNILLFELTSDVPLHEGSLADSTIANEYDLEFCNYLRTLS